MVMLVFVSYYKKFKKDLKIYYISKVKIGRELHDVSCLNVN